MKSTKKRLYFKLWQYLFVISTTIRKYTSLEVSQLWICEKRHLSKWVNYNSKVEEWLINLDTKKKMKRRGIIAKIRTIRSFISFLADDIPTLPLTFGFSCDYLNNLSASLAKCFDFKGRHVLGTSHEKRWVTATTPNKNLGETVHWIV